MCSTALYLLFGKRDAEGKRVQVAVAGCDGSPRDQPGPDPSMVFAWGYGEDWKEGEEKVLVLCGRAAGNNRQEKQEGSSHQLQLQRG